METLHEPESLTARHDAWRAGTIDVLIEVRAQAIDHGTLATDAWSRVGQHAALALRRSDCPRTWVSVMMQHMQIPGADLYYSQTQAVLDLIIATHEMGAAWKDWIRGELQMLLAEAKLAQRERAASRKAETEEGYSAAQDLLEQVGEAPSTGKKKRASKKGEVANG